MTETDFTVDEKYMPATEDASAELFEGIDAVYFLEIGFKAITHELEKLSYTLFEEDDLNKEIFKLKKQMQLVSKKITSFVIKNSFEFNKNVENLDVILKEAESLLNLVQQLRRLVDSCRKKCRTYSVILTTEFKRQLLLKIKEESYNIQKLYKTEFKLKELIEEANIFKFVKMTVEILSTSKKYIEYSSIRQLSINIFAILRKEVLRIDKLLEEQVCSFKLEHYAYIYSACELIGNLEETSLKLQNFFKSALQNASWTILVEICKDSLANYQFYESNDQPSYEELCKFVEQKYFNRSLIEIGTSLVNLLTNYHLILQFHIEDDKKKALASIENSESSECFDAPIIVDKGVLQKSMLDNLFKIFNCAAAFYNNLLSSMDLEHLKIDQFLKIIEISERFRLFGQRHFGNTCTIIAYTLENKSKSFFAHYHMERIDEIHMFLEGETFTICPVSMKFTLFDLPEFYFLKRSDVLFGSHSLAMENCLHANSSEFDRELDFVLIEKSTLNVFPTLEQIESSPSHSCDSKFSSSLSCDSADDELYSQTQSMPNLCNTALNLLRIIGKYLRMAKILQSTSEQVFDAILQLFYYFIYSLYNYFCLDVPIQQQQQDFGTSFISLRLRQLMDSVYNTYFSQALNVDYITDGMTCHVPIFPHMCPALNNKESLFSLTERIIGIESAIFISKQFELIRPTLETLIISKKRKQDLENFYTSLPATFDLLEATLGCVSAKLFNCTQILDQIRLCDWNIIEIPSEHSTYVSSILKEFEFTKEVLAKLSVYVCISEEVGIMLWSLMSMCTVRFLVRGYSESNKCNNEGRALQLMDVEHLFKKLEDFIGLKPFPHRLYVENYVKAFFLPSDDLNQWVVRHTEYTLSQTGALLNASISKTQSAETTKKAATMSRIMVNLLDASGLSDGSNSLFH